MLYVLERLLRDAHIDAVRLETLEDAAFETSDGETFELVQIKAKQEPLTPYALSTDTDGFFHRTLRALARHPRLRITVASYSGFGPKLHDVWRGDGRERGALAATLGVADIDILVHQVALSTVTEGAVEANVLAFLRNTPAAIDPKQTCELLCAWLSRLSEGQERITRTQLLRHIATIGAYLSNAATANHEWFTSVFPLLSSDLPLNRDELHREFAAGIAARREHILANADLPRPDKLASIVAAFAKERTVIVHGASGQGKTTLALRYLEEHTPTAARFSIRRIVDASHAQRIADALASHIRTLQVRALVHIDVPPGERHWLPLIEIMSHEPLAHTLVTIRDEDWNAVRALLIQVAAATLPLNLDETEARSLFDSMAQRGVARYPNFTEAWRVFGGAGPLLEFTFLVSQHKTLAMRLDEQVQRLVREQSAEESLFLQAIVCAGAYGARLELTALARACGLTAPRLTLRRLQDEYLVRAADDDLVEGLHPVRSAHLVQLMSDPLFAPWERAAALAVETVADGDTETLLLGLFIGHTDFVESACERVLQRRLSTWRGIGGALRALLWLDLRVHLEANAGVLAEGDQFGMFGVGLLLSHAFGTDSDSTAEPLLELFALFGGGAAGRARGVELLAKAPPPIAFTKARTLVSRIEGVRDPKNEEDWLSLAEYAYWCKEWELAPRLPAPLDLALATRLPIGSAALVFHSLHRLAPDSPDLERMRQALIVFFARTHDVLSISEDGELITVHFILPIGDPDPGAAHRLTLERIRIAVLLHPGRTRVGSKGYGMLRLIPEYDDTHKTGIKYTDFPAPWRDRMNRALQQIRLWPKRTPDWPEFRRDIVARINIARQSLLHAKSQIQAHFRRESHESTAPLVHAARRLRERIHLPRVAVDPWGFRDTEDRGDRTATTTAEKGPRATEALFVEIANKYFQTLAGFLESADRALAYGTARLMGHASVEAFAKQEKLDKEPGQANVQIVELVRLHSRFMHVCQQTLRTVESAHETLPDFEIQQLVELHHAWHFFVHEMKTRETEPTKAAIRRFEDWTKQRVRALTKQARRQLPAGSEIELRPLLDRVDDRHGLWAVLRVPSFSAVDKALADFIGILRGDTRGRQSPISKAVYSTIWAHFHIVICVAGRPLNSGVRLHSLTLMTGGQAAFPNVMPTEVATETLRALGLPEVALPQRIGNLRAAVQAVAEIRLHVYRDHDVLTYQGPYWIDVYDGYRHRWWSAVAALATKVREVLDGDRGLEALGIHHQLDEGLASARALLSRCADAAEVDDELLENIDDIADLLNTLLAAAWLAEEARESQ
ncbi:MAG: hypothetical protein KBD62_30055 [Kofleriaceae bacterium]|nr:hypothetical protein [Kofleriaceae bacterium]